MPNPVSHAYASALTLHRLQAKVRLGVGDEERSTPQLVFIDVTLYLPVPPPAALNDHAEYTCYYGISQKIHALAESKEFRLIEYLAHEIHALVRAKLSPEIKIGIKLRKPSILLPYVEEGAGYRFTDLPPGSWVAPE